MYIHHFDCVTCEVHKYKGRHYLLCLYSVISYIFVLSMFLKARGQNLKFPIISIIKPISKTITHLFVQVPLTQVKLGSLLRPICQGCIRIFALFKEFSMSHQSEHYPEQETRLEFSVSQPSEEPTLLEFSDANVGLIV